MSNAVATVSDLKQKSLAARLGERFGVPSAEVIDILKATAFKVTDKVVTDAQMKALMIVADQYHLNPFTKEIYAFPDEKRGGIVPVVSVDGWARIINEHPQFDGVEFEQTDTSCTCIIYRKDRTRPTKVTEWMSECKRGTGPWTSHPKRMLRHKALIQCARYAFGFAGIYDEDEAERIIESDEPAGAKRGAGIEMPRAKAAEPAPAGKVIDVEVIEPEAKPAAQAETKPAASETQAPAGETKPAITESMKRVLVAKLAGAGKTDGDLCAAFGIASLEALTVDRMNDALAWVTQ